MRTTIPSCAWISLRWAVAAVLTAGCGEDPGALEDTGGASEGQTEGTPSTVDDTGPGDPNGDDTGTDSAAADDTAGDSEGTGGDETGTPNEDDRPYNQAPFAATHNSYVGGQAESIVAQLDAGVRFLEFDLHTDSYGTQGYTIGHDNPGDEVMLGDGNPTSTQIEDWFLAVAQWSDLHPGHAPLTVLVDFKDKPTGDSYAAGNFAAFNDMLLATLGRDRLFTPGSLAAQGGQWPTVSELADQVLVVLSGNEDGQLDYRRDRGNDPALAINALGQVIEVHTSPTNGDEMWLWTGQLESDGTILWHRHNRYDSGNKPAVAINDDGLIVEVHEDPDLLDDKLWYRVGQLDIHYEVQWATTGGQSFPGDDQGSQPSVAFVSQQGTAVREVHQSPGSAQHWYWQGLTVDDAAGTIPWSRPVGDGTTNDALYPKATAVHMGTSYEVTASDDGPFSQVLTVHGPTSHRVRYEQLAFGSATAGSNASLLADGLAFFGDAASSGTGRAFIQSMNDADMVTRLWQFDDPSVDVGALNFAATDTPFAPWHVAYCEARQCAR